MNAPATNKPVKPVNKVIAKPNTAMPGADQEKAINQLRQEIRTMTKTVKDMKKKPENQPVLVMVPRVLFFKFNAFLTDCNRSAGATVTQSELICEAMDFYLWCEEKNKRTDATAESEKQKVK